MTGQGAPPLDSTETRSKDLQTKRNKTRYLDSERAKSEIWCASTLGSVLLHRKCLAICLHVSGAGVRVGFCVDLHRSERNGGEACGRKRDLDSDVVWKSCHLLHAAVGGGGGVAPDRTTGK